MLLICPVPAFAQAQAYSHVVRRTILKDQTIGCTQLGDKNEGAIFVHNNLYVQRSAASKGAL